MAELFPRFFDAEDLGKSLKEVAVELVHQARKDILSRWFHSSKDADLFIWTDTRHRIIKQQLSYYGQVVEWNVVEGLKTGHVIIDESPSRARGSEILHFDDRPQAAIVEQALALVKNMVELKGEEREELLENFSLHGSTTRLPSDEMIARFGPWLGVAAASSVITPGPLARVWTRLSRWFNR